MEIDIAGKLFPNWTTMIVQLAATAILFYFFKKFLYVPLQNYLASRAQFVESNIQEAKEMNEQAKLKLEESDKLARASAQEYREVVDKAKADAKLQSEKIIAEAQATANARIAQMEKQIVSEREKAQNEMYANMVDVALEAAKKIVAKEIDEATSRKMVEDFVEEVRK